MKTPPAYRYLIALKTCKTVPYHLPFPKPDHGTFFHYEINWRQLRLFSSLHNPADNFFPEINLDHFEAASNERNRSAK